MDPYMGPESNLILKKHYESYMDPESNLILGTLQSLRPESTPYHHIHLHINLPKPFYL